MSELAFDLGSGVCDALGLLKVAAGPTCSEWASGLGSALLAASALMLGLALALLRSA